MKALLSFSVFIVMSGNIAMAKPVVTMSFYKTFPHTLPGKTIKISKVSDDQTGEYKLVSDDASI